MNRLTLFGILAFIFSLQAHAEGKLVCEFTDAKTEKHVTVADCGSMADVSDISISKEVRNRIKYDDRTSLADVKIRKQGCFWLRKNGPLRKTVCTDAGPEEFKEGYARFIGVGGKFGFIDNRLSITVLPKWDYALPFEKGQAKVCEKCKGSGSSAELLKDGKWAIIDKEGEVIKQCLDAKTEAECVSDVGPVSK